jgi:hypothetical protein
MEVLMVRVVRVEEVPQLVRLELAVELRLDQ